MYVCVHRYICILGVYAYTDIFLYLVYTHIYSIYKYIYIHTAMTFILWLKNLCYLIVLAFSDVSLILLPRHLQPCTVILIWLPRFCWPCMTVLSQRSTVLPSSYQPLLAVSQIILPLNHLWNLASLKTLSKLTFVIFLHCYLSHPAVSYHIQCFSTCSSISLT